MTTFVLIHGAGDGGWYWHLVEADLRARGHDVLAPDLPTEDDAAEFTDYADAVVTVVGDRSGDVVVVGQSFGGFTAPLVADRLDARLLVLVAGMIPVPGETAGEWWDHSGYRAAVQEQASVDGGLTGHDDPYVSFFHDVPRELADEAMRRERGQSGTPMGTPWPLDAWPDVETKFVLCTEDRFFPPALFRRLVAERLAIVPDEIAAGHCVALSRPNELADLLVGYLARSDEHG